MDEIGVPALTIPHLIKLKGDDNLMEWKESVRGTFSIFRLLCFINNKPDVPAATTSLKARVKYLRDRAKAHQLLRVSVEPIIDILQTCGWKDVDDRPQVLYDLAVKAVSRVTDEAWCNTLDGLTTRAVTRVNDDSWCNVADEVMSLDATKFDTLRAFLTRFSYCIKKLEDAGVEYSNKAKQAMIIKGLKRYDDVWVTFLKYQLQANSITFEGLIALVLAKENEQSSNNTTAITRSNGTAQGSNNNDDGNGHGILCKNRACSKRHPYQPDIHITASARNTMLAAWMSASWRILSSRKCSKNAARATTTPSLTAKSSTSGVESLMMGISTTRVPGDDARRSILIWGTW